MEQNSIMKLTSVYTNKY